MFTGIVEEVGRVRSVEGYRLTVEARRTVEGARVGSSICVNGACLTVTSVQGSDLSTELTPETLRRTNLGVVRAGDPVDLERPVAAGEGLGGHVVQGHVDGTGEVVSLRREGNADVVEFRAPRELMRYIVPKGFIAVDGASLTVVDVKPEGFTVSVIPATRAGTVLGTRGAGDVVNLEVDILAKYVERLLVANAAVSSPTFVEREE